jgi:hypothetical protein
MTSPIRMHKVMEIKAIREQYKDFSQLDQLFFIFFGRYKIDEGFTRRELIAAFFPKSIVTVGSKQLVLEWGRDRLERLLALLRNTYERGQVPFAQRDENGLDIFFNNEANAKIQLKKRMEFVEYGAEKRLKKVLDTLSLSPKDRQILEQATRKAIIEKALRKRKRKIKK